MKKTTALVVFAFALSAGLFSQRTKLESAPPLPDLIVDQAALRQHWVVRVEDLPATFCSVQEGGVTPGERTLARFTVSTPNIGDADLRVGDPNERPDLFEFATCHRHFHFRHFARYSLIDARTGQLWHDAKRGFCMIDIEKYHAYTGEADNKPHFTGCGAIGIPGNQGISRGWADVYDWRLGGQYFVLDGGDGQPPVPPGDYIIRITVNPAGFVPPDGQPCPGVDPAGGCHAFRESDYANNVAQVAITIPDHPGRQAVGPLKDQPAITEEPTDGEKCCK